MKLKDKVVVVTGGANGIGRALCLRFAHEGLAGLVIGDIEGGEAAKVAQETAGLALGIDVANESDVRRLAALAMEKFGRIDLFCSNAGIGVLGGEEVSDAEWDRMWSINVKAHIYAARAVLPHMLERGEGYLLQTVSAAGLLTQIGSAPYAVTKHAALAMAEWLAMNYGDRGIKVSCLCPQGVKTRMLLGTDGDRPNFLREGALEPGQVADIVVAGLDREDFLILPHPEVLEYFRRKAAGYDRWLRGMRRLNEKVNQMYVSGSGF